MALDRIADFREVFAQIVVTRAGCRDPSIRAAFARVPRHEFLRPGPWQLTEQGDVTPTDDPALVYQDIGIGLVPERGIPTGLPSLHARCLAACAPAAGERVLHVGAGAGYFTAVLAELVGSNGHVDAFEIDAELAPWAKKNLEPWPWVRVSAASGVVAAPGQGVGAPGQVDLVYVCAGAQQPPRAWLDALRPGGRLLFPLVPGDGEGGMLLVRHVGSREVFSSEFVCRARVIPCIGTQDEEASARFAVAFASGTHGSVRSLRLSPDEPDESTWAFGQGWWLSTKPAQ